ncbi:hypothetical protein HanRHA438_Chr03g0111021 [Helianthus annuus]|uniref:Uncharacterized protein n=1 Tax=Helianthus annuus TaxID=4232 RepID=A0A9K3NUW8_HELAN|nr:hypothetical protein HanXRQr2_Chr03g0100021 [Helianthus annuus]KAJ0592287.1 hypothetical protein HanHA300_Chr03g0083261 [Helianthus annuus]KAJ0599797.1 hypothetical protein HanIR_Chr03g0109151 [Helianthus annuus]KAJ0607273.1 hypothetical protein HanHA89_Chr03g0094761 [Helianthus annuus]KAJ0767333.1 hypothetical protein HanLR1_Chr03g0088061 [Helianthus annuus]
MTLDESVPPVLQDVKLHWYYTPWYYDPEPIDDDVWSEDDEGVVEEMELEMPDYTTSPRDEDASEPLDNMEDAKIEEHVPSWEEEFGDDLVGLPTLEYEEFDQVSDLAYLETLLVGMPTMEIKYTPNVEGEEVATKFDSRPVEKLEAGSPPQLKSQEKARRSLDRHSLRDQRWYKRKLNVTLKCKDNHPPHYMSCIRFGPGKFKFWWPDLFACL